MYHWRGTPLHLHSLSTTSHKTAATVGQNADGSRADFAIILNGLECNCDPTVTAELNLASVNRWKFGLNASAKEKDKIRKLDKNYEYPPDRFFPLGFEACGAWGDSTWKFFIGRFSWLLHQNEIEKVAWFRICSTMGMAIARSNSSYLEKFRGKVLSNGGSTTSSVAGVVQSWFE